MFELKIVNSCPVSRGTRGIAVMDRGVVGEIAGAMISQRGIEWAILLLGKREQDGRLIRVTGLSVPKQSRGAGDVWLPEMELDGDVVGVLHSHHSMGAFFSQTDHTQLNPRFGLSIVVAETGDKLYRYKAGEQAKVLGWDYLAEARTTLPCGKLGVIEMDLTTDEATSREVGWLIDVVDNSGCEDEIDDGGMRVRASCGLVHSRLKEKAFGKGTGVIEQGLRENTVDRTGGVMREVVLGRPDMDESRWAGWTDEQWTSWRLMEWKKQHGEIQDSMVGEPDWVMNGRTSKEWLEWQKKYDKSQAAKAWKGDRRELLWGEDDLIEMEDAQLAGTMKDEDLIEREDEKAYWLFDMLHQEWLDDEMAGSAEYGDWLGWLYRWTMEHVELWEKGETGYEI